MKKQLLIVSALAYLCFNAKVSAQETEKNEDLNEVVVTATKVSTNKKNVGKIVYQITSETIAASPGKTIVDFLNDVPGVEINGNYSTQGQNLGYYIRGGRNRQVAILIDGINVNDPSSFNGDFDLRQIDINQVEKIEVLKGASSTLYGTGAATGVINVILKKSSDNSFNGSYTASFGSNRPSNNQKIAADNFSTGFNFNGKVNKVDYLLGLNTSSSSGLSASENINENVINREDKFYRQNALLKLGFNASNKLRFGVFGSFNEYGTEYDGAIYDPVTFVGTQVDMENNLKSHQRRAGFTTDFSYKKGELKVNAFTTNINRTTSPSGDSYKGEVYGFDVYNNYKFGYGISLLTGITAQYQDMLQQTSYSVIEEGAGKQHFYDPYISVNYNSTYGFNLNTGARLNMHNEYGNNLVFNVNPSYNFNFNGDQNLKIFASYSTAFITPTLSEIFTKLPSIEELEPEENITIEGGFEIDLLENLSLNATYFYREETNKIGYFYDSATFQSFTVNDLGTFLARGLETELSYNIIKPLDLILNYSFIDRDESLLLKIPQHKFGARVNYKFLPSSTFNLAYKYVSDTEDFGGVALSSYNVVDLFLTHSILKGKVDLFGGLTNILNEDYQEIAGFSTRGRNFNLGLKINF